MQTARARPDSSLRSRLPRWPTADEVVTMRWSAHGRALAATCVVGAALLAGCSSSKPAVCTDAANLKASVQSLKDTNIRTDGLSKVSDDLTTIKQDFQSLQSHAKDQYATQVNALKTALT